MNNTFLLRFSLASIVLGSSLACSGQVNTAATSDGGSDSHQASESGAAGSNQGSDAATDASTDSGDSGPFMGCLPPKTGGVCDAVETVARNPISGKCCVYPSPCAAPDDWLTYASLDECHNTCPPGRESLPDEMCNAAAACVSIPESGVPCLYCCPCEAPKGWPKADFEECIGLEQN